ncbi:metal-dependent hydrolase [Methanobacterium spitsbergense]|uniref:Metal-dependent hydrolase n=1 Tax=Methanobacterium spitsbergense TaxID=2874285 RepID=A0A8T5UR58_9EURY|nr:metal-dependent hydrolase [Methanobacterium spitsbergense]MBZ2166482.1 metal-dependent hydrolase [Methanobacterium spitsbergense]
MDLFTHFIVPFAILTFLKVKNRLAGAFGGISIDFDVLLIGIGFLSSELFIFTHRGITHSFVFGFITAVIFLYIISRPSLNGLISHIIKRDISVDFNVRNVLLAYFGVLTHLFLDFLTTGGIPLLYPFSLTRFSAKIYYYTDFITTIIALVVLIILYIRINQKYKKIAMVAFLIILISFGGIRVYEKMDTIQSQTLEDGFTHITAYPTADMFTWTVMETNNGSSYRVYNYNNLQKTISGVNDYQNLTITNGTYASAQEAIKYANNLPDVIKFKWNHIYTVINAEKVSDGWNITYIDIMGMNSYGAGELTVKTP